MDKTQYKKQHASNNVFSWTHVDPIRNPSFVVEEHDNRVVLVGVLPAATKDKLAMKLVKKLYPGKTVEFHKDFTTVKKTSFL